MYNNKTAFLLSIDSDKPMIVLCSSKDIATEFNAGLIVKNISKEVGAGGGGPPHFGSSGFNDRNTYRNACKLFSNYLKEVWIG